MKATSAERSRRIWRSAQFDLLRADVVCCFNLLSIRIDEEARKYSGLAQATDCCAHDSDVANHIKTTFSGYLVRVFSNQGHSVRTSLESNLQHFLGRCHLQIQIGVNVLAERL